MGFPVFHFGKFSQFSFHISFIILKDIYIQCRLSLVDLSFYDKAIKS